MIHMNTKSRTLENVRKGLLAASDTLAQISMVEADGLSLFEAFEIYKSVVSMQDTLNRRVNYISTVQEANL